MIPQIPLWELFYIGSLRVDFFKIDAGLDILFAILGLVVSYYGLKLYRVSSKKSHFNLHLGFMVLSAGFLVNGITVLYAILNPTLLPQEILLSRTASISNFGYLIYFTTSIIAYALFVSMYLHENKNSTILPVVMIPFWFDYFAAFNVVSILLLSYVVFQTMVNWLDRKNANTLKVAGAFALLVGYHVFLAFSPFSEAAYILAHLSALSSFLLLITMIRSVSPSKIDPELGLKKLTVRTKR